MPTTTIRLSDELKARVATAAERAGTSPHSFILEAIAEKAEQEERRRDFEEVESAATRNSSRAAEASRGARCADISKTAWPASRPGARQPESWRLTAPA